MQTKLRIVGLLFVASLLWISPASAATQRTSGQTARLGPTRYVGVASWYGEQHQGRKMANGERFDRHKLTAASWYFPFGTTLRVVNLENGKSEMVTITDRGPNLRLNRIIDLSEEAAEKLGYITQGLASVFLFPVVSVEPQEARLASQLVEPSSNEVLVGYQEATSDSSDRTAHRTPTDFGRIVPSLKRQRNTIGYGGDSAKWLAEDASFGQPPRPKSHRSELTKDPNL